MKTIKILISGLVQGVSFRAFIKERAENLGLRGYVKNLDNGKVEIVVEGESNEVNKLIELCKQGPRESRVKSINIEKIQEQGFENFRIIRN